MQLEHILQAHGLIGRGGGGGSSILPTIMNLIGTSNNLGTEINLSWTNPEIIEFQKAQIFMSNNDISNLSYENLLENGNMVVNENKNNHTVIGLSHNDIRYFKAFGIFTILGEEKISGGVSLQVTAKDIVPPGTISNMSAKEDNEQVTLVWINPTDSDFDKVKILYKQDSYPTSLSDGIVGYEGSGTTVTITGLTNNIDYYFRAFTYDASGNINDSSNDQQITGTPSDGDDKTGSPGSKHLIAGTMDAGYFGVVPVSELFTGTELAGLCGITAGTAQFNDVGWLKFAIDGKIIFKSQKTYRHTISWDQINAAGAAKGTKQVTKDGHTYKVRLMKCALTDPYLYASADRGAKGSEWNRLMLPIHIEAKDQSWAYPAYVEDNVPYWGIDFTDADLQTHSSAGNGSYHWGQETPSDYPSNRVIRGGSGVSFSDRNTSSSASASHGWSPVLEWVS